MPLGERLSKVPGVDPGVVKAYVDVTTAMSERGAIAVIAEMLGFKEQPPAPGDAAGWDANAWVEFGYRNNMRDVTRVKHGTKITHNLFPAICVVPSGTPGDVRAGMNCAADFRRVYRQSLSTLKTYYTWFSQMVLTSGLKIDGVAPCPTELVTAICQFSPSTDEKVLKLLGLPGFKERVAEDTEVSAARAYSAMTYLARTSTPPISYPEVIIKVCDSMELYDITRDKAGALSKRIGQAFRNKEKLLLPIAISLIVEHMIECATEFKERALLDRELRKADRVVEVTRTAAVVDPVVIARTAVEKVRAGLTETVSKLGHEISQLNARYDKVKAEAADVDLVDIEAVILAQAKRAAEFEAGVQLAESALQAKKAMIENIAKACGVDLDTPDFETTLVDKITALSDLAAIADDIRKRHVAFASKVHDKLSVKDFLSIAASINELLPEAEKIALSGGEET